MTCKRCDQLERQVEKLEALLVLEKSITVELREENVSLIDRSQKLTYLIKKSTVQRIARKKAQPLRRGPDAIKRAAIELLPKAITAKRP